MIQTIPQTFSIKRGADEIITLAMSPPTSVDGWIVQFVALGNRVNSNAAPPTITLDNADNGCLTVVDVDRGVFDLQFDAEDTADLDPGMLMWSLRRTNAGFVTPISDGSLYLLP